MTFHQFLIFHRAYCERCDWGKGEANEAVTVIKDEHGTEIVVCNEHAGTPPTEQSGPKGEPESWYSWLQI